MNGTIARKLRKKAYGDLAFRNPRYGLIRHVKTYFGRNKEGKLEEKKLVSGQIVCRGPRERYQNLKKAYYRGSLHAALAELRKEKEIARRVHA